MSVPIVGIGVHAWPSTVLLAAIGLVVSGRALQLVWNYRDPRDLLEALPVTARGLAVYSLGFALGLIIG